MKVEVRIPERIREEFLQEILQMYTDGEISAGRAADMLGICRAEFYLLLAETKTPLPEKLNKSIQKELQSYL